MTFKAGDLFKIPKTGGGIELPPDLADVTLCHDSEGVYLVWGDDDTIKLALTSQQASRLSKLIDWHADRAQRLPVVVDDDNIPF